MRRYLPRMAPATRGSFGKRSEHATGVPKALPGWRPPNPGSADGAEE